MASTPARAAPQLEPAPMVRAGDVGLAVLAYIPPFFLLPIAMGRGRRFVLFHGRQGLYLFTVWIAAQILFTGLYGLTHLALDWSKDNVVVVALAVLTSATLLAYVGAVMWMVAAVLRKKMSMLPVLGELAGER